MVHNLSVSPLYVKSKDLTHMPYDTHAVLNWSEYETELGVIIQQSLTQKLWDKTKKYMHKGYGNISNN